MKRKFSLFLLLSLFLISSAQAKCNLEIYRFGSSYQEIQHQLGDPLPVSVSTKNRLFMPGELVCEHEKALVGSPILFIFFYDQLVQIRVARYTLDGPEKPSLVSWAESIYGERNNKPKSFYSDKPDASWYWDSSNALVRYFVESDGSGFREHVIIESRRHQKLFEKWANENEAQ